jgi:D-cysteine desulfhydrase family pyridoxal phosphate-dependent enzyme
MFASQLPRFPLAFLPTPLHALERLSQHLTAETGHKVRIWIKRDDQTGLAGGGNKTRKLEYLVGEALAQSADTLITTGAVQSNHCRQTAAAAACAGLACHLVLGGEPPEHPNGNLLLDLLLGAQVHWATRANRINRLRELEDELRAAGKRPYFITYGGSDATGAAAYAVALAELYGQVREAGITLNGIYFASSSGGTHAGLMAGARILPWDIPVIGVSIDEPQVALQTNVAALAGATAQRLGTPHVFAPGDIRANADYLGGGYGVVGELERDAVALLARTEGILLDPVYTGRAFGGLLDLVRRGKVEGTDVLFWHTGGSPALFAYASEIAPQ